MASADTPAEQGIQLWVCSTAHSLTGADEAVVRAAIDARTAAGDSVVGVGV